MRRNDSFDASNVRDKIVRGDEHVLATPEQLGLDTRADFRRVAFELLDGMEEGVGCLVVDFSATRTVDSAGVNALILVQRHAAARGLRVRLRGMNDELRFLLVLTKLEDLFEFEGPPAG